VLTVKAYKENGGIRPLIPNLGTRQRRQSSQLHPPAAVPQAQNPSTSSIGSRVGPTVCRNVLERENYFVPAGIRIPFPPARAPITKLSYAGSPIAKRSASQFVLFTRYYTAAIKSGTTGEVSRVKRIVGKINVYKISIGKPEGKNS
jgi:hypothetical protein